MGLIPGGGGKVQLSSAHAAAADGDLNQSAGGGHQWIAQARAGPLLMSTPQLRRGVSRCGARLGVSLLGQAI
jgi:hypothetical protein